MIGLRSRLGTLAAALLVGASTGLAAGAPLPITSQAFTPYRICTITATPSGTTVVIDTTVQQNKGTTNNGTATTMTISSSGAANQRAYVRFDLSQCKPTIPPTATVRLATLRLYASAIPAACRTVDIFAVTASWTETGLTWNNQPSGTTINTPASAGRSDSFDIGSVAGCQNATTGYAAGAVVTADVAAFVAGTATNYGWMLRDDVEGSSTTRTTTFSAKNLGTLAQAPQLVVTYVVVP